MQNDNSLQLIWIQLLKAYCVTHPSKCKISAKSTYMVIDWSLCTNKFLRFSLNCPSGPIQSPSCNVCEGPVCVFPPLLKTCFPVDSRLLVKECIGNICIPLDVLEFLLFQWSFEFKTFNGFGSFQTSPLCIIGHPVHF